MTAQTYIQSRLEDLRTPLGLPQPKNDQELAEAIFKIIMSKKYRKYAVPPELAAKFKEAIGYDIAHRKPINMTFVHGAYKLWRLKESPEPDWAELFAAIYYINWLRGICEIYKPGVWFDFFADDLIIPKLNNIPLKDVMTYLAKFRELLTFLKPFQPDNFAMTATGVGEQFASSGAFYAKLDADIARYAAELGKAPEVSEKRSAMIDLNVKPFPDVTNQPNWKAQNVLVHDAYIKLTKFETGYHFKPGKLIAFNQPLPVAIGVGTTRGSIAKFWAGVGVLKYEGNEDYSQIILTPSQLHRARFTTKQVKWTGLHGKNFHQIRILEPLL